MRARIWTVAAGAMTLAGALAGCERVAEAPRADQATAAADAPADEVTEGPARAATEGLPPIEPPQECLPGMACEPLPAFDWRDPAQWMGPSADQVFAEGAGVRIEFDDRERPAIAPHGQIAVAPGDRVTLTVTVSASSEQRIQMGVGRHPIDTPQERTRMTEMVGPEPRTFTYTHTFTHAHPSVRASFGLKGAYEATFFIHELSFAHTPAAAATP